MSLLSDSLVIYQGAPEIRRRQIDGNAWIVLVFEGLADPQSWMP